MARANGKIRLFGSKGYSDKDKEDMGVLTYRIFVDNNTSLQDFPRKFIDPVLAVI